jgi:hypothetical protein
MPNSAANPNTIETARSSYELLNDPLLNKGTALVARVNRAAGGRLSQ